VVGSLLVEPVFVWAKLNIEVCLVVFLVRLVAQLALRSSVNVSLKEGNFPLSNEVCCFCGCPPVLQLVPRVFPCRSLQLH